MTSAGVQPSRLVGRESELSQLDETLSRVLAGSGSVVCVRGGPGVGKSRLLAEVAGRCRERGIAVHRTACADAGPDAPLIAGLELLRSLLDVSELDDEYDLRLRVADELTRLDPGFHAELPLLFDLLGVSDPERPSGDPEPAERRARLGSLLRGLLRARGARGPCLLVVDDVDRIDPISEALLRDAAAAAAESPTLLLLACGPDRRPPWVGASRGRFVELAPLGNAATRALVDELLGGDASLKGLRARLAASCAGRPWLARETVRLLAETHLLAGEPGRFRTGDGAASVELPGDEATLLRERLGRPDGPARRALEAAAVIGGRVPHALLGEVLGEPEEELHAALGDLHRAGFLFPCADEHRFEHPLYRDAVWKAIEPDRRARLHADVALAVEELCFERVDALAGLLAHHWAAAGQARTARRWWVHAARRAGYAGAPPE